MPSERWFGLLIRLSVRAFAACYKLVVVLVLTAVPQMDAD
jgi:hypothetical protein